MSNNLDLTQVVDGQDNQFQAFNDKGGEIDSYLTETLTVSVSAGNATVSAANYRRYNTLLVTGATTGGRTVTLQAIKRSVIIESDSGNTQSISIILGATTLTLAAGKIALYRTDGTANGLKLLLTSDVAGGGGAPDTADYLVRTADGSLSAERVVTDTASVTWDWATAGQAKANVAGLTIGTDVQAFDPQLSSLIRQNSQSADYTTVLTDVGKHILHPSADTTPRTFTIDSNANVAYPIGTPITFVNQDGAGVLTIAITSDILRLAGAGTTGSRTLAVNGSATALKLTTTEWIISGTGLT